MIPFAFELIQTTELASGCWQIVCTIIVPIRALVYERDPVIRTPDSLHYLNNIIF